MVSRLLVLFTVLLVVVHVGRDWAHLRHAPGQGAVANVGLFADMKLRGSVTAAF